MGWYGREKLTKYYSVGFTEKELQEINTEYERFKAKESVSESSYYSKLTNFIKYLALTCIDLQKEKRSLISRGIAEQAKRNTENAMFKEVIEKLNDVGKQIAFKQLQALLEAGYVKTWTGYYHGIEKEGNTIFPKWG